MHSVHILPLLSRLSQWPVQRHIILGGGITDNVLVGFLQTAGSLHWKLNARS